jgi:hypothetical protein
MATYEFTPAPIAKVRNQWPSDSRLELDRQRPTLVMFIHPHCPCSRASLTELSVLVAHCRDRAALQIVFVRPSGLPQQWEQSGLWKSALQIPGAVAACDPSGVEAERFQATASGESFLFAPDGRLLFHGGITPSRGHAGDNAGRAALTALIHQGRAKRSESAVYGCALSNRDCSSSAAERPCGL